MRVQIHSDLHLEFAPIRIKPLAPILILAGDILTLQVSPKIIGEWWEYVSSNWDTVIYVLGNHEFYHSRKSMEGVRERFYEMTQGYENIHILDKGIIELENGCRVMGVPMFPYLKNSDGMNCLNHIKIRDGKGWTRNITKEEWNAMSISDVEWFKNNYNKDVNTILITHYPITKTGVVSSEYEGDDDEKRSQYCQELGMKKEGVGELVCISGHTHYSHDFVRDGVRYISNARGYPDEWGLTKYSEDIIYEIF